MPNAEALRRAIAPPLKGATAAQARFRDGRGSWQGASGEADIRTHRAMKGDERFRVGSVTKTFTAAVVLQLVHEGKLDLEGSVQRYLPGLLPAGWPEVKVKHLLDYTSGLPGGDTRGMPDGPDWDKGRYTTWDHRALVQSGLGKGSLFTPGSKQNYSNTDYNVLGLLIEKATGHRYEQELRHRVIEPLGLEDTYSVGDEQGIRGRHVHGYQAVKQADGSSRLVDVTEWDQSETWASGDLISTTADLERFMTALFSGRVVPQPQLEMMFTVPPVPAYDEENPASTKPATYTSGMQRSRLDDHTYLYGKTGSRYGYVDGFAATRNLSRSLVYAVNSTDAKGKATNPVVAAITQAALAPAKK
ncbi:peptidase [Streptomyces mashuensis]|uniref:Peptidase n=1 Tax=Streptomyces mashuensis TaxID=33904 RepID=A0A919B2J3_9ACTN|nr:peptidase [Streptomyces mashuensis]